MQQAYEAGLWADAKSIRGRRLIPGQGRMIRVSEVDIS